MVFTIFKSKSKPLAQNNLPEDIKVLERKLRIKFPRVYDLTEEEVAKLKDEQKAYEESLTQNNLPHARSPNNNPNSITKKQPPHQVKEDFSSNYMTKPTAEEYNEILRIRKEAKNNGWSKEDQKEWEQLLIEESQFNKNLQISEILSILKSHPKINTTNLDNILDNKSSEQILDRLELFGVPKTNISQSTHNKLVNYQQQTMNSKSSKAFEKKESVFYEFVKHKANGQKPLVDILDDFETTITNLADSFETILSLEKSYVPKKVKGTYEQKQKAFKEAKKYIINNNLENGFIILDEYKAKTRRIKNDGSHSYRRMPGSIIKLRKRSNPEELLAKKFSNEKTDGNGLDLSFCDSTQDVVALINLGYKLHLN